MEWTTLIQAEDLLPLLDRPDVVVLDARFTLGNARGAGREAHAHGHIPGARYADLEADLSDMSVHGDGRHPWPADAAFARTVGRLGISPATQVVVYDAADGMYAARAWFLLRTLGHRAVAVLDGGFARWTALGLPVSIDIPGVNDAGPYPGHFDHACLFDADDLQAHVAHGGLLADARAAERFRGEVEPLDTKAGHVPGAVNRPFALNLQEGRFKSRDVLFAEFAELLSGRTPSDLVSMCGSGVTACHTLLAMAHAGLEGARLYTGSWSGWISDPSRPVATGPA